MPTDHAHRPRITCTECQQTRPHEAKGLCSTCYDRRRKTKTPARSRGRTAVGAAIGRLLPIPPMVRCAGAPGLACDRAARADVGRCWRCQQEAARPGVAA